MLRALQRYVRRETTRAGCELCGAALPDRHAHVIEIEKRRLCCACGACAILFRDPGAGGGRFRTVPDRVSRVTVDGAALGIPVRLAWVTRHGPDWIAAFPSPAGPVEAALERGPAIELEPDVEALLIREGECFRVPIDVCYELAGLVRRNWKGLDGGVEVRPAIEQFFAALRGRA